MKKAGLGISIAILFVVVPLWTYISASQNSLDTNPRKEFSVGKVTGRQSKIIHSAFSKSGRNMLIAFHGDKGFTCELWDVKQQELLFRHQPGHNIGYVIAAASNEDDTVLIPFANTDEEFVIYRSEDGGKLGQYSAKSSNAERIIDATLMPDGETVLMSLWSRGTMFFTLWRWREKKTIRSLLARGIFKALSQDGKRMIAGAIDPRQRGLFQRAKIWDVETGMSSYGISLKNSRSFEADFSPNSLQFAIGIRQDKFSIYDSKNGKLIQSFHPFQREQRGITGLMYSPDGHYLAVCFSRDKKGIGGTLVNEFYRLFTAKSLKKNTTAPVLLYDCETWELVHQYGLNQEEVNVAFLPNDEGLVTIDSLKNVRVWDLPKPNKMIVDN